MIDSLFSAVKGVLKLHARYDDDIVDRLHHRYTVSFLVISAVLVTTTQYIGTPIHCWCPAYFTSNHQQVLQHGVFGIMFLSTSVCLSSCRLRDN